MVEVGSVVGRRFGVFGAAGVCCLLPLFSTRLVRRWRGELWVSLAAVGAWCCGGLRWGRGGAEFDLVHRFLVELGRCFLVVCWFLFGCSSASVSGGGAWTVAAVVEARFTDGWRRLCSVASVGGLQ